MRRPSHLNVGQLRRTQQHALLKEELDLHSERQYTKLERTEVNSL